MPTAGIANTTETAEKAPRPPGPALRWRGLLFLLLGLCVVTASWSLINGVAAMLAWQADVVSEAALPRGAAPGGPEDQRVRAQLLTARLIDPTNPLHLEQLAQHLEAMAEPLPPRSPARASLLNEARALYLESTARRPTWPYTFASILHTDFKLGRFGSEFTRGYVRAINVGLGETVPRHTLIDLGLAAWPVLDQETRELILTQVRQALTFEPRHILTRAVLLGRGALVEPLIGDDPELARLYGALKTQPNTPP